MCCASVVGKRGTRRFCSRLSGWVSLWMFLREFASRKSIEGERQLDISLDADCRGAGYCPVQRKGVSAVRTISDRRRAQLFPIIAGCPHTSKDAGCGLPGAVGARDRAGILVFSPTKRLHHS